MVRILMAITLVAVQIASASDDFSRAVAQAEKARAGRGAEYPLKVAFSVSNQVIESMQDCGPDFPLGSTFDLVLIVSTSGHIERVLRGPISPYGNCIASHLHLPQTVAKPPSGSWPVHIRVLHGKMTPQQKVSPIPVIMDDAGAPADKTEPASASYSALVRQIFSQDVLRPLQKDIKRWGTNTVRVLYQIDRSGQIHNIRVFCKKPIPSAEERIRHALSKSKFPPVPTRVLEEVHSDRVDVEEVIENQND